MTEIRIGWVGELLGLRVGDRVSPRGSVFEGIFHERLPANILAGTTAAGHKIVLNREMVLDPVAEFVVTAHESGHVREGHYKLRDQDDERLANVYAVLELAALVDDLDLAALVVATVTRQGTIRHMKEFFTILRRLVHSPVEAGRTLGTIATEFFINQLRLENR